MHFCHYLRQGTHGDTDGEAGLSGVSQDENHADRIYLQGFELSKIKVCFDLKSYTYLCYNAICTRKETEGILKRRF